MQNKDRRELEGIP